MKIQFDEIVIKTEKAVLIRVNDHQTWLPLQHVKIKRNVAEVPDWLHEKLDWQEDTENIDYVCNPDDDHIIREELLDAICKKRK